MKKRFNTFKIWEMESWRNGKKESYHATTYSMTAVMRDHNLNRLKDLKLFIMDQLREVYSNLTIKFEGYWYMTDENNNHNGYKYNLFITGTCKKEVEEMYKIIKSYKVLYNYYGYGKKEYFAKWQILSQYDESISQQLVQTIKY